MGSERKPLLSNDYKTISFTREQRLLYIYLIGNIKEVFLEVFLEVFFEVFIDTFIEGFTDTFTDTFTEVCVTHMAQIITK